MATKTTLADRRKTKFNSYLKSKSLRSTPERWLILEEIFSFNKHFDVEGLFERMRKKRKNTSRATIYRTLPLLVEGGLIKEALRSNDRIYYERTLGSDHHGHMLCIKCGKVIEFKEKNIERLQDAICKKNGFRPVEHKVGVEGYCKECSKK